MPLFNLPPFDEEDDTLETGSSGTANDIFHQILASQSAALNSPTPADRFPSTTDAARNGAGDLTSTSTSIASTSTVPTTTSTPIPTTPSPTPSSTSVISTVPSAAAASSTPSQTEAASTSKSGGVNSAGIAVLITFLILALCGAAFWFVRRKHIQQRQRRRSTWVRSPIQEFVENDMEANQKHEGRFHSIDINEKDPVEFKEWPPRPAMLQMPAAPPALHPGGYAPPRMASPPPVTITSPGDNAPSPIGVQAPSVGNMDALVFNTPFAPVAAPAATVAATSTFSAPASASDITSGTLVYVARTFVPTLPDELSIQTGEQIRVIARFDDGWAHVERLRSGAGVESGVVPVECLEPLVAPTANAASGLSQEAVEGWRLSKRKSSLNPAGPAQY